MSPPRTTPASRRTSAGYATAPRYLASTSTRSRPRLRGRDVRRRRPAARTPTGVAPADQVPDVPRRALALRRRPLLHRRRPRPAGRRRSTNSAAPVERDGRQTGSTSWSRVGAPRDARAARLHSTRAARSSSPAATCTSVHVHEHEPVGYRAYTWSPDKLFGFYYPPDNARRRRPARHGVPALARRSPTTSWQYYLGVVGRRAASAYGTTYNGRAGRPDGRRHLRRHAAFTVDTAAGRRPEPGRRRHAAAARQVPAACATGRASRRTSRCARSASRPTTPRRRPRPPTAARSSRRVTRSRSASASSRSTRPRATSWCAALGYLLPTDADTTAPTSSASSTRPTTSDGDAARPGRDRA